MREVVEIPRTITKAASDPRVKRAIRRILAETPLCAMATLRRGAAPHINTAYFAFDSDYSLVFLSDIGSQHARNLLRTPTMSVAVYRSSQTWGGADRGLQLFGRCRAVSGTAASTAERLYASRFPLFDQWMSAKRPRERQRASQLRRYSFFRFRPTRLKLFDEKEFPEAFVTVKL